MIRGVSLKRLYRKKSKKKIWMKILEIESYKYKVRIAKNVISYMFFYYNSFIWFEFDDFMVIHKL